MSQLMRIAGGALAIYVVIVLAIAVIPAIELSRTPPGPGVQALTALQDEGRSVFAANGCGYCHTQQVRPLAEDKPFGRPSAPGDFAYQTPELLGSERTGPDLTTVGTTKGSDVWQYIHLYEPRAVVPESIMPNFKFLFRVAATLPPGETAVPVPPPFAPAAGVVVPTPQAKALVAYLLSLRQAPLPGYDAAGATAAATTSKAPEPTTSATPKATTAMAPTTAAAPATGAPAVTASAATAPAATPAGGYLYVAAKGEALFVSTCAACHQASGAGIPGAFPPLKGNAAVGDADATLQLHTILFGAHGVRVGGVAYSSVMPPFGGQLSDTDIANIANYERSAWGNHTQPTTPAAVAAVRAKGP